MKRAIKPNYGSYLKIIIFGFFLIGLFACKKETSKEGIGLPKTESDSMLAWIEFGRDTNSPEEARKEYLIKAYRSANSEKRDTTKLKYFSKIQWSFFGLGDSLWFRKTNRKARDLAQELQDSILLGGLHWDLAEFLSRNKVKDSAYYHFSRAQKIFNSLGDKSKAGRLVYDMALIQTEIKDYTGAEINTVKAIELLKPLDESLMLYRCYNLLGIIAKDLKEYPRSLEYYNTANSYLKKSKAGNRFESEIENNIGVAYHEVEAHEKAVTHFERVLNHDSLFFKNPSYYASTLNNLAKSKYKIDSGSDTESLFLKSLKIRDSIGDLAGMAGGSYDLAQYYLEENDTVKALENVKKAKAYAEQSSNNERLLQSLELLIKLDPGNAPIYGQSYIALNDSLQQEERKLRNKFARIRFETDEVVAENQLLARQKQLWTGIAASLLLLGLSIFVIVDQRIKNQKLEFQQKQQASNEQIFNLMLSEKQKFEEGKKLEQKRISEELHDGVLGKMLGARMVLTGLNKKTDAEAMAERADAITALKGVEGEVRSISHELSHAAYQKIHNFILSIDDLLRDIGNSANLGHRLTFDEAYDWDGLDGSIKINIYRMVQESLQNCVKHSGCKNLSVSLETINDQLNIKVADDGKGFVAKRRRSGIGLRNIASRTKKMNGTWNITSALGKGTTVSFMIPIKNNDEQTVGPEQKVVQEV